MWDKDLVELLITKYKQHDNLYNTKNPGYLDRNMRLKSLLALRQELQTFKKDITIEDIKKKIHTMRTQFIKEIREIEISREKCVREEDVYVSKLWCFTQLEFLKPHCTARRYKPPGLPKTGLSNSNILEAEKSDNSYDVDYDPIETNGFSVECDPIEIKSEHIAEDPCYEKADESYNCISVVCDPVEINNVPEAQPTCYKRTWTSFNHSTFRNKTSDKVRTVKRKLHFDDNKEVLKKQKQFYENEDARANEIQELLKEELKLKIELAKLEIEHKKLQIDLLKNPK